MSILDYLDRKALKRRIFSNGGKINLNATIKDFVTYAGYRKRGNEEGLSFSAYLQLRRFNDITIRDLERIRPYGLKRLMIVGIGEKKAEDLNNALSSYGVKSIPWTTKKYKAWELRKELQKKHGKYTETVGDLLRKD
ncbi:MAG: hypothetical protein Q8L26_08465 [Candidatus Omnitrophota bacterium]|nr:hypothetical protein [Candidatus Omnitrophota bacterium]